MPLYHFVTGNLPETTKAPELDDTNAVTALRADAKWTNQDVSAGSAVTQEIVSKYLSYLIATNFLSPPTRKGPIALPGVHLTRAQIAAQQHIGGRGGG